MTSPLSTPEKKSTSLKRVAILFAGGPAPAANAVISTAAASFLRNDCEVLGMMHGYSHLAEFSPEKPLVEGQHFVLLTHHDLKRSRNTQGIMIGTARTNPGKNISHPAHLDDPKLSAPLRRVYDGLVSLGVDALISIGGDDTLKTANKFKLYQDHLPEGSKKIPVVHLPKTIDNDYMGIDFTFGYFTAVETLAAEIRNLLYDAEASPRLLPNRDDGAQRGLAGSYGAAIAGEASAGDQRGRHPSASYRLEEEVTRSEATGVTSKRSEVMNVEQSGQSAES